MRVQFDVKLTHAAGLCIDCIIVGPAPLGPTATVELAFAELIVGTIIFPLGLFIVLASTGVAKENTANRIDATQTFFIDMTMPFRCASRHKRI